MAGAGAAPGRIVGACRVRPPLRRELLSRQAVASSVRAAPVLTPPPSGPWPCASARSPGPRAPPPPPPLPARARQSSSVLVPLAPP